MPRGCVRKTALHCSNNSDVQNDGFLPISRIDWLDSPLSFDMSLGVVRSVNQLA